jgi:hypothetical protein
MRRAAAVIAAFALTSAPALAAPKKKTALAAFNKGVDAYGKREFAAAAAAFEKSFSLEADVETLFAWAQTERQLDRCDKAIELYEKLLTMKMPDENKAAVRTAIDECKAIVDAKSPKPDPTPDPKPDPKPDAKPDDKPDEVDDKPDEVADSTPEPDREPERAPPQTDESSPRAWWKNPLGGALVGAGVVGVAIGTVFFLQGKSADADKDSATSYPEYERLANDAESKGRVGVIGLVAGGALIVGGVIVYATQSGDKKKENTVSGWVAPDSGGFVVSGRW